MTLISENPATISSRSFFTGLVFGGLAGAATALLLAPRAGAETRRLLREQVESARDQAALTLDEARHNAEQGVQEVSARVEQLQQRSLSLWRRSLNRARATVAAAKASAQEAWHTYRARPVRSLTQ